MGEESKDASVDRKKVVGAVKALRSLHKQWLEKHAKKKPLLGEVGDTPVLLQVMLKKVPSRTNIEMIKIPLPHSLVADTTEVCLFTGDLDKRDRKADIEPTVLHYKELLQKNKIKFISEVVPLRQLRTDYKPYEAKRQLLAGYDVFLADDKIASCLPRVLGKFFFQKRKFPQQVSLRKANLKDHLKKTLSKTVLYVTGRGNTCCAEVARLGWNGKKIVENIIAAVEVMKEKLPGSFANVHGLYLKTERSLALPVYMSFDSGNDVKLTTVQVKEEVEPEEITTLKKTKVRVLSSGTVQLIPDDEHVSSEEDSDFENKLLAKQTLARQLRKRKVKYTNRKGKAKKRNLGK